MEGALQLDVVVEVGAFQLSKMHYEHFAIIIEVGGPPSSKSWRIAT
jgi:hypothetical protein